MFFGDAADQISKTIKPDQFDPNYIYIGLENIGQKTLHLQSYGKANQVTSNKKLFKKGDILLGKLRPYFRKVILSEYEGICSTDIWIIRPKEGIDRNFLFYWCADWSFINFINTASEGTRMPRAKWEIAQKHEIKSHSSTQQIAIGKILGKLDEKIKKNFSSIETLEKMGSSIFQSWFIDFDSSKSVDVLSENKLFDKRTNIFPQSFQRKNALEMPTGWDLGQLEDLLELKRESITPSDYSNELFHHYSIPAFDENMIPSLELGKSILSDKYLVSEEVFLISKLNPRIQRVWLPSKNNNFQKICSTEFLVCKPKKSIGKCFSYFLAKSEIIRRKMEDLASGTSNSHQRVSPDDFMKLSIVIPPQNLINLFNNKFSCFLEKITLMRNENVTLAECRDTLLPKLLHGEIEITNANEIIQNICTE
tara:strand:- start:88 stop:1353 length:1266 start_codon:yes stop_codon:yes gene_type:complete